MRKDVNQRRETVKKRFFQKVFQITPCQTPKERLTKRVAYSAISVVNALLEESIQMRASDIHIEPLENTLEIWFRIDGYLYLHHTFDKIHYREIISRIKLIAGMDITKQFIPQDGRFLTTINSRRVEFRVATLPTILQERLTIRILDGTKNLIKKESLGIIPDDIHELNCLLEPQNGMLLITGPTGSGKTTTLYAFLQTYIGKGKKIISIEDPVEYEIKGISQVQTNTKMGLTFASITRNILRQDPDIVMIGEIRDAETAQIAIRVAITGHLVLSTLHTKDACGAITRLTDMGIPSYLLAEAVLGVVSQRLIRRLCSHCKQPVLLSDAAVISLQLLEPVIVYKALGCDQCNRSGYYGRFAIFEILSVNKELKQSIIKQADNTTIENNAKKGGMKPFYWSARQALLQGETSYEEITPFILTNCENETSQ